MRALLAFCLASTAVACSPAGDEAPETPPYRITASIEEVMRHMVDPSADGIWDALVTVVTPEGIQEVRPETDEDWLALRNHAVTLVESTNLLLMDRPVAGPDSHSEMPGVDLEPYEIEQLLELDRPAWTQLVLGLHDAGTTVLGAVDAQDLDALLVAGDGLDLACENCHIRFWYPSLEGRSGTR